MGNCLGILISGNYAISLNARLQAMGLPSEIMSTPCKLSKFGCSYCLSFPEEIMGNVIAAGIENKTPIKEVYRVIMVNGKKKYQKIYPVI